MPLNKEAKPNLKFKIVNCISKKNQCLVIYYAFCLDMTQGYINQVPNETLKN